MPYPPPVPPATRTDATPSVTNHPGDHNMISAALTEILNHIATLETTLGPIGSVVIWPGATPPTNFLFCTGQTLLKSDYPEVAVIVGTLYGPGDATHFVMPSLAGRSPMGFYAGGAWAATLGAQFGSQDSTLSLHSHAGIDHLHPFSGTTGAMDRSAAHTHDAGAFNNFAVSTLSGSGSGNTAGGYLLNVVGTTGAAGVDHLHPFSGATAGADRALTTGQAGVAPTNTNIPPVTVVNFAMRMH